MNCDEDMVSKDYEDQDDRKMTLLYLASKRNDLKMVSLLRYKDDDIGTLVNLVSKDYGSFSTPLYIACWSGFKNMVEILLNHQGIDVNKPSSEDDSTPLYIASQVGHHRIVNLLLEKGANVNTPDTKGCTPQIIAAYLRRTIVVKLLWDSQTCERDTKVQDKTAREWAECEDSHSLWPWPELKDKRDALSQELLSVMDS